MWKYCCFSVTESWPTLCHPVDCSPPGFPVFTISWTWLKLMSIALMMSSPSHPVCPFFSCPQSFPASGSFSYELVLHIRWPKSRSFSFSISPSSEYSGLISFRIGRERKKVKITQSCLPLCNPMGYSTPGIPVPYCLLEFAQVHIHCISDAILPFHPLLPSFPSAFNLSHHRGLFQWVGSSHQGAKVLELQLQCQSFQRIFTTDFL